MFLGVKIVRENSELFVLVVKVDSAWPKVVAVPTCTFRKIDALQSPNNFINIGKRWKRVRCTGTEIQEIVFVVSCPKGRGLRCIDLPRITFGAFRKEQMVQCKSLRRSYELFNFDAIPIANDKFASSF